jgi:hypothetical protein
MLLFIPLTNERAVDMGGITGQQDPAPTERIGEPPVDAERRNHTGSRTSQRWITTSPLAKLADDFSEHIPVGHLVRLGSRGRRSVPSAVTRLAQEAGMPRTWWLTRLWPPSAKLTVTPPESCSGAVTSRPHSVPGSPGRFNCLSTTRAATPLARSPHASVSPVGPAPAISTSGWDFIKTPLPREPAGRRTKRRRATRSR